MASTTTKLNFVEYRSLQDGAYVTFLLNNGGYAVGPFDSAEQGQRFYDFVFKDSGGYSIFLYKPENISTWMVRFMAEEAKRKP